MIVEKFTVCSMSVQTCSEGDKWRQYVTVTPIWN